MTDTAILAQALTKNYGSVQALRVLGLDPQKEPVAVQARTGYLPGEFAFEGKLTMEGALKYLASLPGNHLDWGFIKKLAERLDLDLKPQFKNLSKGNKQKVGVVQALAAGLLEK